MIVFVLLPTFYAAVEQVDAPELRGVPVLVGGDPGKRGRLTSASQEARSLGIFEGMPVAEALARCPEAVLRPTRLPRYREAAAEVRAILRGASERLEALGLDGTYLDGGEDPELLETTAALCVRIQAETGIAANAGIGPTRFVAWLAARHAGPEAIRSVSAARVRDFLGPFPVTELWGLGPATAEKLESEGISTIAEIQTCARERLDGIVGRGASRWIELARGEDPEPLRPSPRARSFSQERTLADPTLEESVLGSVLTELAERLSRILLREQRSARTITVVFRFVDDEQQSRTRTLDEAISSVREIREVALELLARSHASIRSVRRVRLQLTNLAHSRPAEDSRQLRLF